MIVRQCASADTIVRDDVNSLVKFFMLEYFTLGFLSVDDSLEKFMRLNFIFILSDDINRVWFLKRMLKVD